MLRVLNALPEGLLDVSARDLHRHLAGPTLIHLPGRRTPALFVSVLLHGNEDAGWEAMRQVLYEHAGRELPRALALLIGNVHAARDGLRRQDDQPDHNRVWPGTVEHAGTPEAQAMAEAHRIVLERGCFAAIDIHNNTGLNPHYAVVNTIDASTLQLAQLFSRIVVWFRGPAGTQTAAFARHVPAVAAECGKPGVPAHAQAAARFVTAALHLAGFSAHAVHAHDIDLYHSVAVVSVKPEVSFTFGPAAAQVQFDPRLDHLNFRELPAGTVFGRSTHVAPLVARDESGADVADALFAVEGGQLQLQRRLMPAMLTLDERVVRQDCLCYLMERVPVEATMRAASAG